MSGSNSAACVQVMFRFYQTELLSSRTERVRQEVQEIQFRLPVLHDEMVTYPFTKIISTLPRRNLNFPVILYLLSAFFFNSGKFKIHV